MTKFKKTVLGKILKGVAIAGAAVGTVAAIGATGGAAFPAVGILGKVALGAKTLVKIPLKGAKAVGKAAVNLVSETSAAEREQVQTIKAKAKAAQDQIEQVERLVKAGATRARAESMVGITSAELGSADSAVKDIEKEEKLKAEGVSLQTAGCAPTVFLIIAAGIAAMACTIIIL